MRWSASAPSNIALIKYMGKVDTAKNRPSNASLSYTLDNLLTYVELETREGDHDIWLPLEHDDAPVIELSQKAITRFLAHLNYLKKLFNYDGHFSVRSTNNFPSDCGLASSASSYAALTRVALKALSELTKKALPDIKEQATLSRHASGSSCRSFFSPWCLWDGEEVRGVDLPYQHLMHQVVVVDRNKKTVSSSAAHQYVNTSLLFTGRTERAEMRLYALLDALKTQDWERAYQLCWQEFWDMHALFETASPPFGYMTKDSLDVLIQLRDHWQTEKDGPIITLDAGANIHLLYRPDQEQCFTAVHNYFSPHYQLIARK